jgi:hypothetical protein
MDMRKYDKTFELAEGESLMVSIKGKEISKTVPEGWTGTFRVILTLIKVEETEE